MAKSKNIDHLFKEGLEDFKAKPDSQLEAKMAALIGISGAALASGTAVAASATTATSTAAGSAGAGLGATAVVAKGSLIAKCTAIVKVGALKGTAVLKALGLIKTVATLAVVGTVTTATIVVSEEIIENKKHEEINHTRPEKLQVGKQGASSINTFKIDEKSQCLDQKELQNSIWLFHDEEEDPSTILAKEYDLLAYHQSSGLETKNDIISEVNLENSVPSAEKTSSTANKSTRLNIEAANDALVAEETMAEEIAQAPLGEVPINQDDPVFLSKKGLNLAALPLAIPKMNSLEKGFYLPNYKIQTEFSFMPMSFSHLLMPQIANDTISSHQIIQKAQFSYQIGLGLRIQKKRKPWFLQTGINYQQLKEEVDLYFERAYIDLDQSYWNIDTVYNYFINPPVIDSNIQRIDSAFITPLVKTEDQKKASNTYQFLEIPLRVGYQYHKIGSKWSVEASTGLSFAFHLKSTGYSYNDAGYIINYQDLKTTPQVYCYYLAHIGFNYHLNSMSLFAEPTLKYQLNKKNIENSPYESRYLIYGLKLGVRIQLFKNGRQP